MQKNRSLPKAIHIGPMRSGTTWLQRYFETREDILLPKGVKETHFFDTHYSQGLEWYRSFFTADRHAACALEIAPTCFHKPEVPRRMLSSLGSISSISTLRNPVDRAFSHYPHLLRYGYTRSSFRETATVNAALFSASRYAHHVKHCLSVFKEDDLPVLFFEYLQKSPSAYIQKICGHLNVPFLPVPDDINKKIDQAALPKSYRLAAFAQKLSVTMHYHRLHVLLKLGKAIGLKELFFGKPLKNKLPEISADDYNWFLGRTRFDIEMLEELLKIDLTPWKKEKMPL